MESMNFFVKLGVLIFREKVFFIGPLFLTIFASILLAYALPNKYLAYALVGSSGKEGGAQFSGIANQLGGLASIAGLSLGGGDEARVSLALQLLESRDFTIRFIEKYEYIDELMASTGWDASGRNLEYDDSLYNEKTGEWTEGAPSLWAAYKKFQKLLRVRKFHETGFIEIGFEHYSPDLASTVVQNLITEVNESVRQKDIAEAKKSVDFLNRELDSVSISEMRGVFYGLIEEQSKKIMLANVREDYVLAVVDPARPPAERFSPKRSLICLIGGFLGGVLGCMAVFLRLLIVQPVMLRRLFALD